MGCGSSRPLRGDPSAAHQPAEAHQPVRVKLTEHGDIVSAESNIPGLKKFDRVAASLTYLGHEKEAQELRRQYVETYTRGELRAKYHLERFIEALKYRQSSFGAYLKDKKLTFPGWQNEVEKATKESFAKIVDGTKKLHEDAVNYACWNLRDAEKQYLQRQNAPTVHGDHWMV